MSGSSRRSVPRRVTRRLLRCLGASGARLAGRALFPGAGSPPHPPGGSRSSRPHSRLREARRERGPAPGGALPEAPPSAASPHFPSLPAGRLHHLLGAAVDAVLKYEGRIDSFPADGLLASFGAVCTREDDAERAIRTALAIRAAARQQG